MERKGFIHGAPNHRIPHTGFPVVGAPYYDSQKVFSEKCKIALTNAPKYGILSVSTPEREGNSKMKQVPKNKRYHKNNKRQLNSEWRVRMCGFVSSRSHRIEKMERKEFKLGTVLAAV
jgi:hypothetical protein